MRILFLATDVYGGHGGIARFNRMFVQAMTAMPECEEVVVVPRIIPRALDEPIPPKVRFVARAAAGRIRYLLEIAKLRSSRFDLVICGHIHLLPVARTLSRDPILVCHGIEAWKPPRIAAVPRLIHDCRLVVTVSELTRDRLVAWSGYGGRTAILPNTIRPGLFQVRPKRQDLVDRYGLAGRRVLLTVGRLAAKERYKGFDEVIDVLPQLPEDVVYLVAGGGDDLARLRLKCERLGLQHRVIFTGEFPDDDKPDLFNLADVYVMPSRGEGFGIVFLEALACGLPVIGSCLDGGREALMSGKLGTLVDPTNPTELALAIEQLLRLRQRTVPEGLDHFSHERFGQRVAAIVRGAALLLESA